MTNTQVEHLKAALIVVDMQEDFCPPSGSLAIAGGRDIAPAINSLLALPFALKIATKDWHPNDHVSFHTSHDSPDVKPFQSTVTITHPDKPSEAQDIPVWPVHCVQNTRGAEIIPEIDASKVDVVVEKGKDKRVEMFSVFADGFGRKGAALSSHDVAGLLKDAGVQQVFVTGLAADYCALHTAVDAKKEGFEVFLVEDAVKSVDPGRGGWGAAKEKLRGTEINIVSLDGPEVTRIKDKA